LDADYPILDVFTMPEVITLDIIISFPTISSNQGSKGVPAIEEFCRINTIRLGSYILE